MTRKITYRYRKYTRHRRHKYAGGIKIFSQDTAKIAALAAVVFALYKGYKKYIHKEDAFYDPRTVVGRNNSNKLNSISAQNKYYNSTNVSATIEIHRIKNLFTAYKHSDKKNKPDIYNKLTTLIENFIKNYPHISISGLSNKERMFANQVVSTLKHTQ